MNKKIIIVTGYLAGGKTTFANKLGQELGIPCFNKDYLKIILHDYIPAKDSKHMGAAVFDVIVHITQRFMESGNPLIIESTFNNKSNYRNVSEGNALQSLIDQYGYKALTYLLKGDPRVLHKRFLDREKLPERETIYVDGLFDDYRFFKQIMMRLDDFDVGERVTIDTTDFEKVDFAQHIKTAISFMERMEDITSTSLNLKELQESKVLRNPAMENCKDSYLY